MIFKYSGFFTGHGLLLPMGISFYTFQMIGWLIDLYRREIRVFPSFLHFGTWASMWPHMSSGPILRWKDTETDLGARRVTASDVEEALRELTIGLAMKVLLANQLSGLWQKVGTIGYESISTPFAWLGLIAFTFQIYFDFYGYSLMAVGLGRLLGFHLPENFHYPYMACSMTEFWRRWHMTLGSWFRDYVYIPLGGSRCSRWKLLRNLLVVWRSRVSGRGRMEFPFVGRLSVCYDCGRKISLFKNIESVSMVGTSLYDDIDSAVLAAFCSGRNSEYRSVSGTIVPVF